MPKPVQANKLVGFFAGIDPATKNDYFTIFTHMLTEKPKSNAVIRAEDYSWLPFPVSIVRLRKRDPNDLMDIIVKHFNKFPPMSCTIDKTREEFLSAGLIRKYGESKIIQMHFGNVGSMNTKFQLKQLGYSYIHAGYQWPSPTLLEKTNPVQAKLFRILKKEMMMEQVKFTETDRVTFSHPMGKHNDLVHAWEMSLNSVMEFQKKNLGFVKRGNENPLYSDAIADHYTQLAKNFQDNEEDPIYNRNGISSLPFR